jgi:DNA-binding Lrp family transcriptional regulator
MSNLNPKIKAVFDKLKSTYSSNIVLKYDKRREKNRVYEFIKLKNPKNKKEELRYKYIGYITDDGFFIPIKTSFIDKRDIEISQFRKINELEEQLMNYENEKKQEEIKISKYDEPILTALSMNARLPYSKIGKLVGLERTASTYQVEKVIKKYNIKQFLELRISKQGFFPYLIFVKFLDKSSIDILKLTEELKTYPEIQLAAMTIGKYDMFMYILSLGIGDPESIISNSYKFLKNYKVKVVISEFDQAFGFIPLRNEFFEKLKDKVWIKSKEHPRPDSNQFTSNEFEFLRELNKNPTENFVDIDKKLKFDLGMSRFLYNKILKKGIIARPTISILNNNIKQIAIISARLYNSDISNKNRQTLIYNVLEKDGLIDNYCFIGDYYTSRSGLFVKALRENRNLEEIILDLRKIYGETKFDVLIVTDILFGEFVFRRFDETYTDAYNILVKEYGLKPTKKIDYLF